MDNMDILDNRQDTMSSDSALRRLYVSEMHWTEKLMRELRSRDLTLTEVAQRADVNYGALQKQVKRGKGFPRDNTIEKLSKFLKVSLLDVDQGDEPQSDRRLTNISELDVRADGGAGLISPDQERVINEWHLPTDMLAAQTSAPSQSLRIITVIGTSMEPDFRPGERVLVDTGDRLPSPAGAFALWDGFGLVIKYVEIVPSSEPAMVRLISRNAIFDTYERPVEDVHINGRIIGKWLWT